MVGKTIVDKLKGGVTDMFYGEKRPFTSQTTKFNSSNEAPDFNEFYDMAEEGLTVSDIAKELNINEQFLSSMVNQMYKED
jgi:hypothetical protein